MKVSMLTTRDNPWDPFDDFDSWYSTDMELGYDCCGRIARVMNDSVALTEMEREKEKERAIDFLIKNDVTGNMVKRTYEEPIQEIKELNDYQLGLVS